MSDINLEDIFGNLIFDVPTENDGSENLTLSIENLPPITQNLTTSGLYIKKGLHSYEYSYNVDQLIFYAHKEMYRNLGLLIFSKIFNPEPSEICFEIKHSESDIKYLIIEFAHSRIENLSAGLHLNPFAFEYYPQVIGRHPFNHSTDPAQLPCFGLTNLQDFVVSQEDLKNRNVIRIFGSAHGLALLAEMLLNLSQSSNEQDEIILEGEGGFRGVGVNSAEARFYLPGHQFWFDEHWK